MGVGVEKSSSHFVYVLIHAIFICWLVGLLIYAWPFADTTPLEYFGYFAGIFIPSFFFDRWKREWRWRNVAYPKVAELLTEAADDVFKQGESKVPSPPIVCVDGLNTKSLEEEAESFGIKLDGNKYRYGLYRYEKLIDAVNYARLQANKPKI